MIHNRWKFAEAIQHQRVIIYYIMEPFLSHTSCNIKFVATTKKVLYFFTLFYFL